MRPIFLTFLLLSVATSALAAPKSKKTAAKKEHAAAREAARKKKAEKPTKEPAAISGRVNKSGGNDSTQESSSVAAPTRGPARIDFDDRLIQGQTNKSGAVYLYDRKELISRSMIKKREQFRDEIRESLNEL